MATFERNGRPQTPHGMCVPLCVRIARLGRVMESGPIESAP